MSNRKRELRSECLARRQGLSAAEIADRSQLLADNIIAGLPISKPSSIFLYSPFRGEPNLLALLTGLPEVQFSLPVVSKIGDDMEFYRFCQGDQLVANKWGIMEPDVDDADVPSMPDEGTLVIVPSVALDADGYRLGYGAGYYDRYLVSCPNSISIGVCFSEFIFDSLPHDYWDRKLNFICSESGISSCG